MPSQGDVHRGLKACVIAAIAEVQVIGPVFYLFKGGLHLNWCQTWKTDIEQGILLCQAEDIGS